ncbi:hypothetical protein V1478_000684 [Vespula squamosa]|uniref:Uncharacterized protein n=1 Tax=Vespula squamosa TaxID=30214 RepID=A0ABD2C677_VESSQ
MIKVREKTEAKLSKLEIVSAGIEDGWVIRPTLVEYKAAGGLGSESRGQSEPVGRAQRQPQPQTERLRAASAPEHRPH